MRLIVIGGGAAGIFCAVNAARLNPSLQVILVEKSGKLLSKVRISGGGRCNVTHACYSIPEMIKNYPRGFNFVKKTFHHFFTHDTIAWFEQRGVLLKTEADGRMFPVTDSSESIITCLLKEVNQFGVEVRMNKDVKKISRKGLGFLVEYESGQAEDAEFVCIACGGFPKLSMFDWITELGHTISPPVPSLFTFNMPGNPITGLMGISVADTVVKVIGSKLQARGPLLITHWGMSGPAILKLSAWGAREFNQQQYDFKILVNWLPSSNDQLLREEFQSLRFEFAAQLMHSRNPFGLPLRLWQFLLSVAMIPETMRWADMPAEKQNRLIRALTAFERQVKGKTTYKEEFVTAGGVDLSEINASTMESKLHENLYFAGEILDVDGVTGGFNFQHAWTSGWIAANAIAQKSLR